MRGAQCDTDHMMQRAILVAAVRPPIKKTGISTKRFNTSKLLTEYGAAEFRRAVSAEVGQLDAGAGLDTPNVTESWGALSDKLRTVCTEVLGYRRKRHQDWFDENNDEIVHIVAQKNQAHNNYLS